MDIEKTKKLIRIHEGYREFPYDDKTSNRVQGKVTIGYGRNLNDKGVNQNEAELMLDNDLSYLITQLPKRISFFGKLDDVRQAILCDMAYNIGINGLLGFNNMLDSIEKADYADAAFEIFESKLHNEEPLRTADLIGMMRSGHWPNSII